MHDADGDAAAGDLHAQRFQIVGERGLAGRVRPAAGNAAIGRQRGDAGDLAVTLRLEVGDGGVDDGNRTHQVGLDDAAVLVEVAVAGAPPAEHAGIGDDEVDAAEALHQLAEHRRHARRVGHVEHGGFDARAAVAQLVAEHGEGILAAGEQAEGPAAGRVFAGQAGADAARGADDDDSPG